VAAVILEGTCPNPRIDDLNPEQLRAATAGEGPVLTIAGAGTGKTKTLASRVAWLVSQGIDVRFCITPVELCSKTKSGKRNPIISRIQH
jgi:UvrD/REP helicase N-terminal domain